MYMIIQGYMELNKSEVYILFSFFFVFWYSVLASIICFLNKYTPLLSAILKSKIG